MRVRSLAALAVAAALLSACSDDDSSSKDEPEALTQQQARAEVPLDGIDGTPLTWRLDPEDSAESDPVGVVQALLAIEAVGSTFQDPVDDAVVAAFADPGGYESDLRKQIDPDGAEARRWGALTGPVRAWVREMYRGTSDEVTPYPNLEGDYVVVAACIDRTEQQAEKAPEKEVRSGDSWFVLQKTDRGWTVKDDDALAQDDGQSREWADECYDWARAD